MQSDIIKKIDVLVEMAGATSNIDTLYAELMEIEKESEKLKRELSLLMSNDLKEKYFKASEKQVDENIKVSLESKIRKQEISLDELQEQIDSVVLEESKLHDSIAKTKEDITSINSYITALSERILTMKESSSLEKYKAILNEENKHIDDLVTLLNEKENEYAKILDKLNYLDLAKSEIETKLKGDKERLLDTKSNLVNPASYIDEELKEVDEERTKEIGNHLLELDKRRIEIITDPAMIAAEAKNLIEENDTNGALSKLKELVTIVKSKPYMSLSSGEVSSVLQEELESANIKRDEFASLIDSKDYTIVDTEVLSSRILYLTDEINEYKTKIEQCNEEINRLDTNVFANLNEKLNRSIEASIQLEQSICEYEEILKNTEDKTPKRRAILNAAFQKKKKDLENLYMVIDSYKEDQKALVERTHEIESVEIVKYEELIQKIQIEIDKLNEILSEVTNTKDVLDIENDRNKLKELDENVKAIKHRQKYSETPDAIYDEFEIMFGAGSTEKVNTSLDNKVKENIISDKSHLEENDSYNDMLNQIPKKEPVVLEEHFFDIGKVMNELPSLAEPSNESERLKVVSSEPISENLEKENSDNPFLVADYKENETNNKE